MFKLRKIEKFQFFKFILRDKVSSFASCKIIGRTQHSDSVKDPHEINRHGEESQIRNIGILAHVDAGKTTTTERMLFYSGYSRSMGEVDDGDTVMDYMAEERARGITITSAVITFNWKKCKINLIDTPGHVDFTMEVERAICALDGAVTILDSSAGVEAQTLTVWQQADRYGVPRIIYLNKLDKSGSNIQMCMNHISQKLKKEPLLLQIPLFNGTKIFGIVDLVNMNKCIWQAENYGKSFACSSILNSAPENDKLRTIAIDARRKLIENAADLDNELADVVLAEDNWETVEPRKLQSAIRRITLTRKGIPLLCGSSYKNVGVQLLMDGIIDYLPSPAEAVCANVQYYDNQLCALIFKIIFDPQRNFVSIVRIYTGELSQGQKIFNVNRNCTEKVGKIYIVYANEFREVSKATAGNIVAISGLKNSVTGDTIVPNFAIASKAKEKLKVTNTNHSEAFPLLGDLQVPDPVFFCSIEPASLAHQTRLDFALECLKREDPSLQVRTDTDTGQIVLSGMGELHLEVIKNRIRNDYKVDADLGPLQVSYRETVDISATESITFNQNIGNVKSQVILTLSIQPSDEKSPPITLRPSKENQENLSRIWKVHQKALETGIHVALQNGPLLGFPLVNVQIGIHWLDVQFHSSLPAVSAAASKCVASLLRKATPVLMEPIMRLEVLAQRSHLHNILGDLSNRRGQVLEINDRQDYKVLSALVPLAETLGYSTNLRIITSGLATFTMELDSYQKMTAHEQQKTVHKMTGLP